VSAVSRDAVDGELSRRARTRRRFRAPVRLGCRYHVRRRRPDSRHRLRRRRSPRELPVSCGSALVRSSASEKSSSYVSSSKRCASSSRGARLCRSSTGSHRSAFDAAVVVYTGSTTTSFARSRSHRGSSRRPSGTDWRRYPTPNDDGVRVLPVLGLVRRREEGTDASDAVEAATDVSVDTPCGLGRAEERGEPLERLTRLPVVPPPRGRGRSAP